MKKRVKPDHYGRVKETGPPVPVPNSYVVAEIERWVQDRHHAFRSLPVAAPVLAIVCALHEEVQPDGRKGRHLPVRERLAAAVEVYRRQMDPKRAGAIRRAKRYAIAMEAKTGKKHKPDTNPTSDDAVDAVISNAAGFGDIEEIYRTEEGGVTNRQSIRRRRYLIPCKELMAVYRKALREHERVLDLQEKANRPRALPAAIEQVA
jgi:hypothetical protein